MNIPARIGLALLLGVGTAHAAVPSTALSYFVPEAGPIDAPIVGQDALRYFRLCPNNDGTQSLPRSARIKIVIKDGSGHGISGIPREDIDAVFNGGTHEQGFDYVGADSIIANGQWNPGCPDMAATPGHGLSADAPTDLNGVTYLTFTGASVANPGVGVRDPNRKWGHYDSAIPIFALGFQLQGRLTEASANGSYVLQIKNVDSEGGLKAALNQGELVNSMDIAPVLAETKNGAYNFWHDFDWDGVVGSADLAFVKAHNTHSCTSPLNP